MCGTMLNAFAALSVLVFASGFEQQYFTALPQNLTVKEGSDATLKCQVANVAGPGQWVKDGFAMGYNLKAVGLSRYTYKNPPKGIFDLRIVNVSLEDDGVFECQVAPTSKHKALSAKASLNVIAPPNKIEITNHLTSSKLEVKEGDAVTLECIVKNAKPAAEIVWFRSNVEVKASEASVIPVEETPKANLRFIRYTTKSKLRFKATADDDYADYTCEARHEALPRQRPLRVTVQLSVMYPPGAPYIEGLEEGEIVRRGQNIDLVCRSRGGNPPAQLVWYRNGEQAKMAFRTIGRISENILSFKAAAADHKARFTCEAKNIMISKALKASVDMSVVYTPEYMRVTGPTEARVGEPVPLTCTSAPANPMVMIKWVIDGKIHKEHYNRTVISPEGGWVSTSNTTVFVDPASDTFAVLCYGVNMGLTENVVATHTISVLYPPSAPIITGYVPGTTLTAGTVQKLECMSTGGNPLATLTWFKNDKKIHSPPKQVKTGKTVRSELSILTNVTDNQAQYRCEAANSATEIPLFETVTLNVHFAPETVRVEVEPTELTPGVQATLLCHASSSNPPSVLSWWRDGIPVQGLPAEQKRGLHFGYASTAQLKLNVTKYLNGAIYTCQATNEVLARSVNDAIKLKVLYAPIFDEATPYNTVGVENEPLIIVLRAEANPDNIIYTWTKDGLPITQSSQSNGSERILYDGSMLNMTRVSRHDAGVYSCEAVNSQGASVANITVNVHYGASIKSISQVHISNPKEDATLSCTADGNPLTAEHIRWERKDYSLEETLTTFDAKNLTSYLIIREPTRDDVGIFQCVVDNGIGGEKREDIMFVVKFKPEMESAPNLVKSASNVGDVGKLTCRCKAAPVPSFTWSKNGVKLMVNTSTKYYAELNKLDPVTYSSVLLVNDVSSTDYGTYECGARNDLGFSTTSVKLDVTTAPDQVISLTVTNVTNHAVVLEWTPGFDGGVQTWYRVRYRKIDEETYKYEDVVPKNSTTFTVQGLEKGTDYVFSIMAINKLGQSKYRPDDTKATTLSIIQTAVLTNSDEFNNSSDSYSSYFTGTLVGTGIISIKFIAIGLCLHRRLVNKRVRALSEVNDVNVVKTTHFNVETSDLSKTVIIYTSATGAVLVLINIVLFSCYVLKRRRTRRKEQQQQTAKSAAAIEMYAPSSYNDTMTGETLSSVSEKSETYSQNGDDRHIPPIPDVPNRHVNVMGQTSDFIEETVIIPPPLDYPPNYEHARTLPHQHRYKEQPSHGTLGRNTGKQNNYVPAPSPMPTFDGSYHNMSSERYLSYPPIIGEYLSQQSGRTPTPPQQYAGSVVNPKPMFISGVTPHVNGSPSHIHPASPPLTYGLDDRQSAGGTLRRQRMEMAVPPPDVTVLHPGICSQHPQMPKQPQSILKDPSRHKYGHQYGSPIASSTPQQNNSNQILTVQNLPKDVPQYGTIRKDKKQNVTIDETLTHRTDTHVV